MYLFFHSNYWCIGSGYNPSDVFWSVYDEALKPEFITSTWRKWSVKKWEYQYGALVQCTIKSIIYKACTELECLSNSTCYINRYNNSYCSCLFGYTGSTCKLKNQNLCPTTSYTKFLLSEGATESIFCPDGTFSDVRSKTKVRDNTLQWMTNSKCKTKPQGNRLLPDVHGQLEGECGQQDECDRRDALFGQPE